MDAGDLLAEAKSRLLHGEFGPWLAENCSVGDRQARRYMKLASARVRIEANWNEVGALPIEAAIGWLAPRMPEIAETKSDFKVRNELQWKTDPYAPWTRETYEATARFLNSSVWELRYCEMVNKLSDKGEAHFKRKQEQRDQRWIAWEKEMRPKLTWALKLTDRSPAKLAAAKDIAFVFHEQTKARLVKGSAARSTSEGCCRSL
jgi:hypothetical protein